MDECLFGGSLYSGADGGGPSPASVGGSEEPVNWEQGLGTRPLSESVLEALAQELENTVKRDPLPWYCPNPNDPPYPGSGDLMTMSVCKRFNP